jgi:hypothetical protein
VKSTQGKKAKDASVILFRPSRGSKLENQITADDWTVMRAMKAFPGRRQQWIMIGGFLRNLRRPCELKMEALKNAEVHHDFLASAVKEA